MPKGAVMRVRVRPFSREALAATAACVLLVGCGGGGGDGGGGGGGGSGEAPQNAARLDCLVTDAISGKAVGDATVNYQAKTAAYTTQTTADGRCRIELPIAEVTGVEYPAGTVTKPGYEPQTIICESFKTGNTCDRDVSLIPLAINISIPVGGDTVSHIGDDAYEGSTNSQFQKPSDGPKLLFPISDWAAQVARSGVTTATVYLDAKGWQSDVCRNQIAIVGDTGTQSLPGGVSPAGGFWGGGRQVPFVFEVARIGRLNARLELSAGSCSGTTDIDDFEINRIRVEFN